MTSSGHVDTFARDALPPKALWPEMRYDRIPELAYPERLNCATELLDRMAERNGDRPVFHFPGGMWTYRHLLEQSNQIAHVLVDDLGLVCVVDGLRGRLEDLDGLHHRYRLADASRQRATVGQLHSDVRDVIMQAEVEHRQDVGVLEAGYLDGFAAEALISLAVGGVEHLERHVALQRQLAGAVDRAHGALTDLVDNLEAAQLLAAGEVHESMAP